jgi:hypothetical protein
MTINVYVSLGLGGCRQYGFLPTDSPVDLLPAADAWTYVRSAEAAELGLTATELEHLESAGFETREALGSYSVC